jgi:poly-gamma-glutamate capsule biosynthesis protein CapA/YwtB (metallophosphatase superfamily)
MADLDDELIGFTGDVSLHGELSADLFEPLARQIECRLILSYESVLAPPGVAPPSRREKIVVLAPDDRLDRLARLDIAAVCVANNHISDFGDHYAEHTIDRLSAQWQTFGAGKQPDHFHRVLVFAGQSNVAIASYCLSDTMPLHANETRIGPQDFSEERFMADQKWAEQRADHFVVLLHWGDVHTHYRALISSNSPVR